MLMMRVFAFFKRFGLLQVATNERAKITANNSANDKPSERQEKIERKEKEKDIRVESQKAADTQNANDNDARKLNRSKPQRI